MKVAFGVFIGCELARVRLLLATEGQFERYLYLLGMTHSRALAYIAEYFNWAELHPRDIPTGVIE